ncbi:MAG: excinuclease ABC subunit UvrA [Nitrospinaceae bacterium]|nr:excinuclease ABC subunit UvrA [Nitrospinaceae bacterium]NIR54178.1 excinuclease ABC subunit UvrA [Nitrospinaceae bacterium]NIS84596.1 excinuclease ABC subunit UvrA [Nitrospinaceae bacterium]NIT81388.1 excinuclease ABC subunit UvrA [Nitrospinaceae bacterium]NIU43675.1 excinuclease ABC subunit UvrA [Nitrospinaceae bacterium]
MALENITIKGAREHNLKNITLTLPREKLVVITGLSGSGKSSLAFDTIYAEGQRRYVESLSAYARQFLELMEKPDVDYIEGLSPAISIEQKTSSKNPRSTVGTVTEIYDYLRLLYARIGHVFCYGCGRQIASQTVQQITDQVQAIPEGRKVMILAPIVKDRKGEFKKDLLELQKKGFVRARVDGEVRQLEDGVELNKKFKHTIEAVVDRLVIKSRMGKRLADSIETALQLGEGSLVVSVLPAGKSDKGEEMLFSEKFACSYCGISYPELEPRLFSFNNPTGACFKCDGLGNKMEIDPDLVVPDPALSIRDGAILPWQKKTSINFHQMVEALAQNFKFKLSTPFKSLSRKTQDVLLYGAGDEPVNYFYERNGRRQTYTGTYDGIIPDLERRYHETESASQREEIARYMRALPCPACKGTRLKKEAVSVKVGGRNIVQLTGLSIGAVGRFFEELQFTDQEYSIARRIVKEIRERLQFLVDVGLDYLTLNRTSATLSGGESQRIRLATQIGSSLMGVLYVLDEPSIGLHQRDNDRLLATLTQLRDLGNTVIVVEHDENTITAADHIVDLGLGAGIHGGEVIFSGPPKALLKNRNSLTAQYLSGRKSIPVPKKRRKGNGHFLEIKGARHNNLKEIDVSIPLGCLTCVTGVSGSGKSTLTIDILYKALAAHFWGSVDKPGAFKKIKGIHHLDKVIDIDQSPIGRTPRSNPATYTGLFTLIRDLFSEVPEARMRGYKPGRFSFNVKGGRCEACQGDGLIKVEMHFLPDVFVTCEVCQGKRFNRETLEILYKGKTIADVLEMTTEEAEEFFQNIPAIRSKLETITSVGLDYIHLGQPATTLSGGEAQRVKLAKELSKRSTGQTLYILDEPTTGLHFHDIGHLLGVIAKLVDAGNTVIVIEHNLDVIKTADYIIDLGPDGGDGGGEVVACGVPEQVVKVKASHTGRYLKPCLNKK